MATRQQPTPKRKAAAPALPQCYLQWHWGDDDPGHGRLSLSVIPVEKAQSAALRAALRREDHPYTTLFHGTEQECLRERTRIDLLTATMHEERNSASNSRSRS